MSEQPLAYEDSLKDVLKTYEQRNEGVIDLKHESEINEAMFDQMIQENGDQPVEHGTVSGITTDILESYANKELNTMQEVARIAAYTIAIPQRRYEALQRKDEFDLAA